MCDFLFVTANEQEKAAFEKHFKRDNKHDGFILGQKYYNGKFGKYNVSYIHLKEQGTLNPQATPLLGELVKKISPTAIIMVGIAFGVDETKQKIGDVLVSKTILPYDPQKIRENCIEYKECPKEVGYKLLNAFSNFEDWNYKLSENAKAKVHIGSILTGSRLIDNLEYRNKLVNDFNSYKPIGGEMEAQGIYLAARIHQIPEWIIVKSICDWASNKHKNKEENQIIAAKSAVDYCLYVFSHDGIFEELLKNTEKNFNDSTSATDTQNSFSNMTTGVANINGKIDKQINIGKVENLNISGGDNG